MPDPDLPALTERLHALQARARRRAWLDEALEESTAELSKLEQVSSAEARDVRRIEGLGGLFARLTGTHAERLSKEQREHAVAELRVERKRAAIEALHEEREACAIDAHELARVKLAHGHAEWKVREALRARDNAAALAFQALEDEIEAADAAYEHHAHMHTLIGHVCDCYERAQDALRTASSRAGGDAWVGGDLLSFFVSNSKYRWLDAAEKWIASAEHSITALSKERPAFEEFPDLKPDIGQGLRLADHLLDSFLVDGHVAGRIDDCKNAVDQALEVMRRVESTFAQRADRSESHAANLKRRMQTMLAGVATEANAPRGGPDNTRPL